MKFHLLPLAFCAALAGCATYVPYDYPYATAPYYGYNTGAPYVVYPSPYPYTYGYGYPYGYAYGYSPIWISGTWFWGSGGRSHRWDGDRRRGWDGRNGRSGATPHRGGSGPRPRISPGGGGGRSLRR